jgi:hypothetical protein
MARPKSRQLESMRPRRRRFRPRQAVIFCSRRKTVAALGPGYSVCIFDNTASTAALGNALELILSMGKETPGMQS